jgi:hypothetical protein
MFFYWCYPWYLIRCFGISNSECALPFCKLWIVRCPHMGTLHAPPSSHRSRRCVPFPSTLVILIASINLLFWASSSADLCPIVVLLVCPRVCPCSYSFFLPCWFFFYLPLQVGGLCDSFADKAAWQSCSPWTNDSLLTFFSGSIDNTGTAARHEGCAVFM